MAARVKTTPRKRPRQARSRATVDAVLEATARVLVEVGYDKATTNRIAADAGVSIGSLYQYFPNKQALVAALIDRHVAEMNDLVTAKLADARDHSLRDAARELAAAMIEAHALQPELHRVLMEQIPVTGRADLHRQIQGRIIAMVRSVLEARKGEIRRDNLDLCAFVLCQAVESLTHAAVLHYPEYLDDSLADEVADLVCRYALVD